MKILVVEDKYEKICQVHSAIGSYEGVLIDTVMSVSEALKNMKENSYQILIVDVQIPDIKGGDINESGGISLLNYLSMDDEVNTPLYVMGLSSYKDNIISKQFSLFGWPLFHASSEEAEWIELLKNKVHSMSRNLNLLNVDIAILTALEHTELEAVLRLDCSWNDIVVGGFSYSIGSLEVGDGKHLKVVACSSDRMGVASASEMTSRVYYNFKPKAMLMAGICAGIRTKVDLGDVVVADFSWDWGAGKLDENDDGDICFHPDPHHIQLDTKIRKIAKTYSVNCEFMYGIYSGWNQRKGGSFPKVYLGPMACGSQVLANQNKVDEIIGASRKVHAIEMESYGFLNVCNSLDVKAVVAKSVCDFADREKNDGAQEYAAYTSASFIFEFIKENYSALIY